VTDVLPAVRANANAPMKRMNILKTLINYFATMPNASIVTAVRHYALRER
jgi:hypothetical protein